MAKTKSALQDTYEQLESAFDCSLPEESIDELKKIASGELKLNAIARKRRTLEEIVEDIRAKRGDEAAKRFLADREMRHKLHLR